MAEGTTGGPGGLLPEGESLRRALQYLDDRIVDDPKLDRARAVSDAAMRFDLTPLEEDFLIREWARRT